MQLAARLAVRTLPTCSAAPLLRRGRAASHPSPGLASSSSIAASSADSPEAHQLDDLEAARSCFRGRRCMIQGASRGLGLEFVRQLLEIPDTTVVATCRNPQAAEQLQQLAAAMGGPAAAPLTSTPGAQRLHIVQLDVCDEASINSAANEVGGLVPSLDLLINCSAVLHGPSGMAPETSYSRVRADQMQLAFQTNAIGPMLVCSSFLPLLLGSRRSDDPHPAILANMSARVGSLGDNRLGGWYSYRASKAALNQLSLTLSLELRRKKAAAAVVMLHPGTCDTDLSRPYHKNVPPGKLFDRQRGVRQLLGILGRLRLEDSGRFIAWDGQVVPW